MIQVKKIINFVSKLLNKFLKDLNIFLISTINQDLLSDDMITKNVKSFAVISNISSRIVLYTDIRCKLLLSNQCLAYEL